MSYQSWTVVYGEQPSASKWNILGSNDAHFYSFLGADLAWDSYTPTITGLTGANNTVVGKYKQIGRFIRVRIRVTLGVGFGMTTMIASLPVATIAGYSGSSRGGAGYCRFIDTGSTSYLGTIRIESTSTVQPITLGMTGSYVNGGAVSSAAPMTWASTDILLYDFMYEAAS